MADQQGGTDGGPSSLSKLMIRGVRSFSPDRDEAIEFYSPLTMIVGANGCGKTTIIESLKFATTGQMPPGANKGQSFVNDPGMTDSTEVKGSIKLRFNNANNEVCILQRSMQLTKKKTTLAFKQLDGSVKEKDQIGNMTSLSYKCADLDRYIPQILGVSAAILENVIFCHQEESSWPMLEGAVLKRKFDDIFESSRYTKALDAFAKSKKEFQLIAKDYKAEVMQAVAYLETSRGLHEELETAESASQEMQRDVESLQDQLDMLDERLDKEKEELEKVRRRYGEVTELQRQADEEERRYEDKKTGLERIYTESDYELTRILDNFESAMSEKQVQLDGISCDITSAMTDIEQARERSDELMVKKGTATSLSGHMDSLMMKFDASCQDISTRFDIPVHKSVTSSFSASGDATAGMISSQSQAGPGLSQRYLDRSATDLFWDTLNGKITSLQADADSRIAAKKHRVEAVVLAANKLRDEYNRHEVEIEGKNKELSRIQNEIEEASHQIRGLNDLKRELDKAESEAKLAKEKLLFFTEPSEAGGANGVYAMSALSQAPSGYPQDGSQLGYDEGGNFLGYNALMAQLQKKASETSNRIMTLTNAYNSDASHLLQLSTRRKDLDMKQAALKQVEADIHDERAKLTSMWGRSRSTLGLYLTNGAFVPPASSSSSSSSDEVCAMSQQDRNSQTEAPIDVETLTAQMGTLERALMKLAKQVEAANKAVNTALQEQSSAEAVLYQSKASIAKMEGNLRVARQAAAANAAANSPGAAAERPPSDPQQVFMAIKSNFSALVAQHGGDPHANLLNMYDHKTKVRKPESNFAMPTVAQALEVMQSMKDHATKCKYMTSNIAKMEQNLRAQMESAENACPLCLQEVSKDDLKTIDRQCHGIFLKDEVSLWDKTVLKNIEKSLDKMMNTLRAIAQPLQDIERVQAELDAVRTDVAEKERNLMELRAHKKTMDLSFMEASEKCSTLEKVVVRLREISNAWQSKDELLRDKRRELDSFAGLGFAGGKSIEELEQLQAERLQQKEQAQREKDGLLEREKQVDQLRFALQNAATEADNKLLDIKQKCAKVQDLEAVLRNNTLLKQQLEEAVRAAKVARSTITRDLEDENNAAMALKVEVEEEEFLSKATLDDIRSARDQFKTLRDNVVDTQERLSALDLQRVADELATAQARVASCSDKVKELQPRKENLTAELREQERTKKTVRDNLELRAMQKRKMTLLQKVAEAKKKLGLSDDVGNDTGDVMDEENSREDGETMRQKEQNAERAIQKAEQTKSRLIQELFRSKGKLENITEQCKNIADKLSAPNLLDIEKRHRKAFIQHETTELAVKDLESYHKALDMALQDYHATKIKEINKIIRELWQLIYKGQDIEMIELESGVDGSTGASTAGARSYNYRVVMRKGNHPLDMRGRCSAGQRVLAAIVIRLALAETFCLNCGILALDEPTTNLDDANKAGLATALAHIIVDRSQQQNFQLICITHDEDFVKLMSMELAANSEFSLPEYYFRVSREEDDDGGGSGRYFSHIERILWSDM